MNAQKAAVATSPIIVVIVDHVVHPHRIYELAVNQDKPTTIERLLESIGLDDLDDGVLGVFRECPSSSRSGGCHLEGISCKECVTCPLRLHRQEKICLGVIIRESPPMLVPLKGAVAHCQQTEKFAREKKGCKKTVKEVS